MGLQASQIKQEIKEPKKKKILSLATQHQNRIKFHVQTSISPVINQPLTNFFAFVENVLPKDKVKLFKTMFRYPMKTNEVTGIVFDRLSRIFDGRNPAMNYQFLKSEFRDDWEYYRQDVLKEPGVWSSKGWDYFQTEINSVLVVDMPSEPDRSDSYPQPYFYWLTIDRIITYAIKDDSGVMDWIIFRQGENIVVIDDERYRVFKNDNQTIGELLVDNPHDLGYCPCRFFWNVPLNICEPDIKAHPLTKALESLDWFLFYHISKRILDIYGSYPIYSGYEQDCTFSNAENGDVCDGGFLRDKDGHYKFDQNGLLCSCPKCGNKRIVGPGSFVEVPIPRDKEMPDLKDPVSILTVDVDSLNYNVSEVQRLKDEIINSCVGRDGEVLNTEAVNESQVTANFESQSTILNRIKKGFEQAQQFVDETICKLRYGKSFVSASINLGTEFFTTNPDELRSRYKIAKDSGASDGELDLLQNQIYETEYRNNPLQLQRMIILSELEPFRHLTRDEVTSLFDKQLISKNDLIIKLNFSNFVRKFERENTNLLEFGTNIPFSKKIDIITNKFNEYVSEKWT